MNKLYQKIFVDGGIDAQQCKDTKKYKRRALKVVDVLYHPEFIYSADHMPTRNFVKYRINEFTSKDIEFCPLAAAVCIRSMMDGVIECIENKTPEYLPRGF